MATDVPTPVLELANKHPKLRQYLEQQKAEIKHLKSRKKYGLVWEEEKIKEDITKDGRLPVLKEITSKRISTDKQYNVLIEGDNLHALSILNYTHKGKIDIVYIDPPYNTGNKTWKYNNNFVDKDDGFRHSKWISFMNKRLRLAKKLLSKHGTIIIAIDDYEIHTLRLLMDEIFGENNRLGTITVVHNPRGRNDDKHFATMHEYMLIYSLNPQKANIGYFELTDDDIQAYNLEDDISNYTLTTFIRTGNNSDRHTRPKMFYPIYYNPETNVLDLEPIKNSIKLLPLNKDKKEKVWRWTKKTFLDQKDTELVVKNVNGTYKIYKKRRLLNLVSKKPRTVWYERRYDASSHGIMLLRNILDDQNRFPYPKSLYTVFDILKLISNKDSIILDFFAGSGTTGHAVLKLNNEDDGQRQFILCTNNENDICTEVCYPRIKNIIKGRNSKGEKIEKLGGGLVYYKISQVEKEPGSIESDPPLVTDANKRRIITKVTEMLCMREWCFDLVHQTKLSVPKFSIYKNNVGKYMGIVHDPSSVAQFTKKTDGIKEIKIIHTYVFSEIMSTVLRKNKKIKFKSIPSEILGIWSQIFESNIPRRPI